MDGLSSATASPQSPARACALAERDGQRGESWVTAGEWERKGVENTGRAGLALAVGAEVRDIRGHDEELVGGIVNGCVSIDLDN